MSTKLEREGGKPVANKIVSKKAHLFEPFLKTMVSRILS